MATTPRTDNEQAVGLHKLCYTCTLMKTVYADNDHYAGQMDCINPNIDSMEVSRIECDGPCGVSIHVHVVCVCVCFKLTLLDVLVYVHAITTQ